MFYVSSHMRTPEDIIANFCVRPGTDRQYPGKHAIVHQTRKVPIIDLARAYLASTAEWL